MTADSTLYGWLRRIDEIQARYAHSIENLVQELNSFVNSDEFVEFLWSRYGYVRGNLYVQLNPQEPPKSWHRLPEDDRIVPAFFLPWLGFDQNGQPYLIGENDRSKIEAKIDTRERFATSTETLVRWLRNHEPEGCTEIIVPRGEMVFSRLFANGRRPAFKEGDLEALRDWLDTEEARLLAKELLPPNIECFLKSVAENTFRPTKGDRSRALRLRRINPVLELDELNNQAILFFRAGAYYAFLREPPWVDIFCLVALRSVPKPEQVAELKILFRRLAHLGVEYTRQQSANEMGGIRIIEQVLSDEVHHIKKAVAHLRQEIIQRNPNPNRLLRLVDRVSNLVGFLPVKADEIIPKITCASGEEIGEALDEVVKEVIAFAEVAPDVAFLPLEDARRAIESAKHAVVEDGAREVGVRWHKTLFQEKYFYEDILNALRYSGYPAKDLPPLPLVRRVSISRTGEGLEVLIANPVTPSKCKVLESRMRGSQIAPLRFIYHVMFNRYFTGHFRREIPNTEQDLLTCEAVRKLGYNIDNRYDKDIKFFWVRYTLMPCTHSTQIGGQENDS